jgi:hypothetical protein
VAEKTVATAGILVILFLVMWSGAFAAASVGTELISAESDYVSIRLAVPRIRGLDDWLFEEYLNASWRLDQLEFAHEIHEAALMAKSGQLGDIPGHFFPYVCWTDFEVKYNQDGMLSLVILFYEYTGGAHGHTRQQALNYDFTTKRQLSLNDAVGRQGAVEIILDEINRQIAADPEWYFPDVLPLSHLNEEDFYLTEAGLVVFYQLYEIAPYAAGIREFVIPWHCFETAELVEP